MLNEIELDVPYTFKLTINGNFGGYLRYTRTDGASNAQLSYVEVQCHTNYFATVPIVWYGSKGEKCMLALIIDNIENKFFDKFKTHEVIFKMDPKGLINMVFLNNDIPEYEISLTKTDKDFFNRISRW